MSDQALAEKAESKVTTLHAEQPKSVSPLAAMLSNGQHDVDSIERYWQIQQQWEAGEARKAYFAAMASVRSEMPTVKRSGVNKHLHSTFATLDDLIAAIGPILGAHGVSLAWSQKQLDGRVMATCTATHVAGHSESSEFSVPVDKSAKGVNVAQQEAIASTYARRYAFTALIGVSTGDDVDAQFQQAPPPELITAEEMAKLIAKLKEVEKAIPGTTQRWTDGPAKSFLDDEADNDLCMSIPRMRLPKIMAALQKKLDERKGE